jgi:ribonuclease HII
MILGIDEVGRGAWAGPLVVGAVVLGSEIDGLTDSKVLSAKRREHFSDQVYSRAAAVSLGWIWPEEIDEIGLSRALREATARAVRGIHTPFHEIIIDGTVNFLADTPLAGHVKVLKKADLLIPTVSAAAIVAKVARDQ